MSKRSVYKKNRKHNRYKPGLTTDQVKAQKEANQEHLAHLRLIKGQRKTRVNLYIRVKRKGYRDKNRLRKILRKGA